jgi:hypothetical protein
MSDHIQFNTKLMTLHHKSRITPTYNKYPWVQNYDMHQQMEMNIKNYHVISETDILNLNVHTWVEMTNVSRFPAVYNTLNVNLEIGQSNPLHLQILWSLLSPWSTSNTPDTSDTIIPTLKFTLYYNTSILTWHKGHKFHTVEDTAMGWEAVGFGICLPLYSLCIKISLKAVLGEISYTLKWKKNVWLWNCYELSASLY